MLLNFASCNEHDNAPNANDDRLVLSGTVWIGKVYDGYEYITFTSNTTYTYNNGHNTTPGTYSCEGNNITFHDRRWTASISGNVMIVFLNPTSPYDEKTHTFTMQL